MLFLLVCAYMRMQVRVLNEVWCKAPYSWEIQFPTQEQSKFKHTIIFWTTVTEVSQHGCYGPGVLGRSLSLRDCLSGDSGYLTPHRSCQAFVSSIYLPSTPNFIFVSLAPFPKNLEYNLDRSKVNQWSQRIPGVGIGFQLLSMHK